MRYCGVLLVGLGAVCILMATEEDFLCAKEWMGLGIILIGVGSGMLVIYG